MILPWLPLYRIFPRSFTYELQDLQIIFVSSSVPVVRTGLNEKPFMSEPPVA